MNVFKLTFIITLIISLLVNSAVPSYALRPMASSVSADESQHPAIGSRTVTIKNRLLGNPLVKIGRALLTKVINKEQPRLDQGVTRGLNLSSDQLDRAFDLGYAFFQLIERGYVRRPYLNWLMGNKKIWSVIAGLSDGQVVGNLNNEQCIGLINILNIINTKLNTSFDILPLADNQVAIYDRERLRFEALNGGMSGYRRLYKEWETDLVKFNTGLRFSIINELSRKRGFFYDRLHSRSRYKKKLKQAKSLASQIIDKRQVIPRTAESPITDMAFPTARDAKTLKRCMSSFLISIFAYGYNAPTLWVMDDAEGDVALEKQEMLKQLAKKYNVTINYVGQEEKERFLDLLAQNPHVKETGLTKDELIRIYFQPGKFGSNRNYVQSYCSGKVYSTVDDDALFASTIEKDFFPTILCQANFHGLEKTIAELYKDIGRFKIRAKSMVEIKILASDMAEEFKKHKESKGHSKITILLHRLLTALYSQPPELYSQDEELIARFAKNIPVDAGELKTEVFTSGKETFMDILNIVDFDDPVSTINVLVNAFGVHSRLITKSADTLQALRFQEGHSYGTLLPFSITPGKIGFVESLPNLTGAGSSMNDLDYFISREDLGALNGERKRQARYLSLGNVIIDRYRISTTTFMTIDNRDNFALVVPGMIDSHPLGMFIQGGDRQFKLFMTMLALDHLREPSPTRNWRGNHTSAAKRTVKNLIDETGLMTALYIHFDLQSQEEAIRIFANDMCNFVQELRVMADSVKMRKAVSENNQAVRRKKKHKKAKSDPAAHRGGSLQQTISDLIESIRLELDGIPIPDLRVIKRKEIVKARKAAERQAGVAGINASTLEYEVSYNANELGEAYLALPHVKDNILEIIARYTAKIEEVERYSKNVHLASRQLRDEGILPFNVFGPDEGENFQEVESTPVSLDTLNNEHAIASAA